MKLISLVTGCDDVFSCDYVLVNLTSNLAQLACRRVAMLKEQKHLDDSLVESYFWDAHADYFSPWLAEQETDADALAEIFDRLPALAGDWMEAPAEFSIPDSLGRAWSAARWSAAKPAWLFLPSRNIPARMCIQARFPFRCSKR